MATNLVDLQVNYLSKCLSEYSGHPRDDIEAKIRDGVNCGLCGQTWIVEEADGTRSHQPVIDRVDFFDWWMRDGLFPSLMRTRKKCGRVLCSRIGLSSRAMNSVIAGERKPAERVCQHLPRLWMRPATQAQRSEGRIWRGRSRAKISSHGIRTGPFHQPCLQLPTRGARYWPTNFGQSLSALNRGQTCPSGKP